MLAPRKALWSTPDVVTDQVMAWLPLTSSDTVYDIGCGDGRVLLRWAARYSSPSLSSTSSSAAAAMTGNNHIDANKIRNNSPLHGEEDMVCRRQCSSAPESPAALGPCFVGIDISADRIVQSQQALEDAQRTGRIQSDQIISFVCGNALNLDDMNPLRDWLQQATVVYLFLTPRGMRMIQSVLPNCNGQSPERMEYPCSSSSCSGSDSPIRVSINDDSASVVVRHRRYMHIVSYMFPLPDQTPIRCASIAVPHQPGAAWPLYLYRIERK